MHTISRPEPWVALQINLFLRVMRRREDGYHDLASLFHVSLHHPHQARSMNSSKTYSDYV